MITLTEKAVQEVKRIIEKEPENQGSRLRVQVVGGGCSGLSYKLGFDKEKAENDKLIQFDGVEVVVDSKSSLFIDGMTLDFTDGLQGQGFVFRNPKAKRTCGCGSSFSA